MICVPLLLCRGYLRIPVDDDMTQSFFPQNFAVYVGDVLTLRYGDIMFALPGVSFPARHAVRRVQKINITLPAFVEGFQLIWKTLEIVLSAVRSDAHGHKIFSRASAADQGIAPVFAEIGDQFSGRMRF